MRPSPLPRGAQVTDLVIAVLVIGVCVFGGSAGAKLRSRRAYQSFLAGLGETMLVPSRRLSAVAAILAAYEAMVAAGLATAVLLVVVSAPGAITAAESALGGATSLTMVLTAGIALILHRHTQARCACFGSGSDRPLGAAHLVRNVCLLVVLVAGLVDSVVGRGRPGPASLIIAAAAGAVCGIVLIRLDDLTALFMPIGAGAKSRSRSAVGSAESGGRTS